jgi:hypothetical protein
MGFSDDIRKFQENCEKKANAKLRKIGLVALRKIVTRTPVRTGCARSNWNVSINRTDESFDPDKKGKSGGDSINRGTPIVMNASIGCTINMVNTTPYIISLEHGHSRQRPEGFLKLCQEEVQRLIDKGAL